ncbi:MAG: cation-translocating P-type ATPase [Alkalispirochaeta sp.]
MNQIGPRTRSGEENPSQVPQIERLQMKIGGMSCSFCSSTIEKAYGRMEGVKEVHVSLAHEEALVRYDSTRHSNEELRNTLTSLGYTVRDPDKVKAYEEQLEELHTERRRLFVAAGATAVAGALMVAMWAGAQAWWFRWVMLATALGTVFGPGLYILKMAFQSIRRGILNQHVLLEFAAFAGLAGGFTGLIGGIYLDLPALRTFPIPDFFGVATFVTTYHILSSYVAKWVRARASRSVQRLLELQPDTARVVRAGEEIELALDEVSVGEQIRVRPGERIPLDGKVAEGNSGVNEGLVTGESMPQEKAPGDEVIGGSINQSGSLLIEVTRAGEESFLRQVARHLEEARALKPSILQLVDLVLRYYVPGVIIAGTIALLSWTVGSWIVTGVVQSARAIFATLAVFVMGYPCALGMATPLAMIRGGGEAAEHGVLIRSGQAFQILKDIGTVVFDKTGTLTEGKPRVTDVVALNAEPAEDVGPVARNGDLTQVTEERIRLLRVAASLELLSEHPLGRSIFERAQEEGQQLFEVEEFAAVPGKGVRARLGDGTQVQVGRLSFLEEGRVTLDESVRIRVRELEAGGKSVVGVAEGDRLSGLIALTDRPKPDSANTIAALRRMGIRAVLLTGDNQRTADAVAAELGIEEILAEVLPGEKAQRIRELQRGDRRVAMVGDGINDAPALMQADIGIAIGAGTDIAIESSDVVLVSERLSAVVDAVHIGRRSYRKTVQNLRLAFLFNGVGVPAAITGLVHPAWAMVAMVASVTTVLANSFAGRLLPRGRMARNTTESNAGSSYG